MQNLGEEIIEKCPLVVREEVEDGTASGLLY